MPAKKPDDTRIVSLRLHANLLEHLDRYLDWRLTHQRVKSTRNTAMREALSAWLDHQEQVAGRLEPDTLRQQFQATYDSICHRQDGVPIPQLRQLLRCLGNDSMRCSSNSEPIIKSSLRPPRKGTETPKSPRIAITFMANSISGSSGAIEGGGSSRMESAPTPTNAPS